MNKSKVMNFFSDLGRSLLMPIAALAACGIVLGLSAALLKAQVQAAVPVLSVGILHFIITTINKVSGIVFTLIPVLFAISIAFGLAKEEKEIAAFAGFIGYYTFLVASACMINSGFMDFSALKISTILGVETMDMGAVAGMITGIVTAALHNKYHKVTFPVAVSFYGGKRFVALVVILAMTAVGLIAPLVWAPVSMGIDALGGLISAAGLAGIFCYGFLERLLIPTGLHHVLNGIFRTTAIGGVFQGVEGCLNIFLQFVDKVDLSELQPFTVFLGQGKMPMMMFGLPGAALAIYRTAPAEKKARVKALMIAGVAASVVSGITEPMEFSFMFVAQALEIIEGLGGKDNIKVVNNCLTRLRVDVKDMSAVDEPRLKKTGAMGFVHSSDVHIQVIYGPKVEEIAANVREALKKETKSAPKQAEFSAPITGNVIPMEQVPDPAFSQKMMGDGFAIEPTEGVVQSPVDGIVEVVFPTGHAVGLRSDDGSEILIHLGIDTVELNGKGFEVSVKQGDRVKSGDVLVKVDLDYVKSAGKKTVSPVIFTSGEKITLLKKGMVSRGEKSVIRIEKA